VVEHTPGRPQGTGRQKCRRCSLRSIPGLVRGQGLCPYHWAEANWGKAWAERCYGSAARQAIAKAMGEVGP
jgi:hypothetical protein